MLSVRARVIIIRDDTIALIERYRAGRHYYVFPGGGVEPGETDRQALFRELREEAGLRDPKPGRRLWRAQFVTPEFASPGGGWLRQRDDVYLVRVRRADVSVPNLVDEQVIEHRWWTLAELERSPELFGPLDLPRRVRDAISPASGS